MAEFLQKNIDWTIKEHEGGIFTKSANDPPTKWGVVPDDIQECVQDGILDKSILNNIEEFIKELSLELAAKIHKHQYWDKLILSKLVYQNVADKIFDMALVMGRHQTILCSQRACRSVYANQKELIEDGIIGPYTLAAINLCFDKNFLAAFRSECAGFYRMCAKNHPEDKMFLKGWLTRAYL